MRDGSTYRAARRNQNRADLPRNVQKHKSSWGIIKPQIWVGPVWKKAEK